MTIYRSPRGKRALEEVYTEAVEQLGIDVDERYVETTAGETHLLLTGPTGGEPVLVFHEGNATNPMTLAWYAGLAEEHRLVAPDTIGQPGFSAETPAEQRAQLRFRSIFSSKSGSRPAAEEPSS